MKLRRSLCGLLAAMMLLVLAVPAAAEPGQITSAADVEYKTFQEGGLTVTANWGTRGQSSTFLSPYAVKFYAEDNTYEVLSAVSGGTSQADAHQSELYAALAEVMKDQHSHVTSYQETRPLYRYTDCQENDTSTIASFYSGMSLNGTWDSGATWNREHTWPNSKGLNGSDENDIMMLRPTSVKENSSRGNKAYGESSGYYDPGADVRGDCARITLYVYTRWGNTGRMWGADGVMESLEVLLRWMQEDPVDTWEMGRNDAVQSITGTRNVFVDYPEYAFLLFGQEVPEDMVTPSKAARTEEPPVTEPSVPPATQPAPTEPTAQPATQPEVTEPSANPTVKPTEPVTQQPKEEPFPIAAVIAVVIVAGVAVAAVVVIRKKK